VMLRLYILRHAKSAWPAASTGDHDRPLNKRGVNDLPKIGQMLLSRGYIPNLVLCSSAQRTLETWNGIAEFVSNCPVEVRDDLYESTTSRYLTTIRSVEGTGSLMLIGHNPVSDELTRLLITGDGPVAAGYLPTHFPTGGLAVLDIDAPDWRSIQATSAELIDFVRPRTL
jgi:phosphohistidine phosphatase